MKTTWAGLFEYIYIMILFSNRSEELSIKVSHVKKTGAGNPWTIYRINLL